MPVSGNYGTPTNPYGDIYSSFWELQWYSGSDPAHVEGDFWGRSDLTSGDKIATVRFDNGSAVVDIPLFPDSTNPDSSDIKKKSGIQTPNGEAWMPVLEGGGAYSFLGYQHGGTRHGVHDSLTAIPDSAIYRYKFDEGSGSTATDSWNGNDATVNGATYTTTAQVGSHALDFDGTDDYVRLPDDVLDGATSEISLSYWILPDLGSGSASSGGDRVVSATSGSNRKTVTRWKDPDWHFGVFDGSDTLHNIAISGSYSSGSWYHVVNVYDGADLIIYINGSEDNRTNVGSITLQDHTEAGIGASSSGQEGFSGIIDDPRSYTKGLTSTEVSNLYNTGRISG